MNTKVNEVSEINVMPLKDQVALVTGASRGIGQAIALALARQGATVIGTATTESGAEAITAYLQQASGKGAGRVLQVNDAAACDALVEAIQKEFSVSMPEEAIVLSEPIKKLGECAVTLSLHSTTANITLIVSKI